MQQEREQERVKWNGRDQLAGIIQGLSPIASYLYDPFARRQKKTLSGSTTEYLYDRANPVQEKQAGVASADLVTGLGIDEHHTRTDSAGQRTILTDVLGSTVALADTTGAVPTSYSYEPFGKTTTTGAANGNTFQYTGRETDAAGLTYYRARHYNPTLQRFISEDPIGLAGVGFNFYAYVGNTPGNGVDPSGLGWCLFGHVRGSNSACRGKNLANDLRVASRVMAAGAVLLAPVTAGSSLAWVPVALGAAGAATGAAGEALDATTPCRKDRVAFALLVPLMGGSVAGGIGEITPWAGFGAGLGELGGEWLASPNIKCSESYDAREARAAILAARKAAFHYFKALPWSAIRWAIGVTLV